MIAAFSARLVLVSIVLGIVALSGSACGGEPVNQTPIISSVSGEPVNVAPGGTATITCVASDPDGDRLSYTWSTTGGSLSGTGKSVTFTAPDAAGTYLIGVTVADGKGGTADKSHTVTVVAEAVINRPPVIASLSASLETVEPQKPATVTCVATDPDGDQLTYSWWTNLGRIEGAGSVVTWTAPPYLGEYIIDVTVRDNKGGVAVETYKVTVAPNESPVIESLDAKPGIMVLDHSTTITCEAEDPDGDQITYSWSTTEGSLSGTGKAVTWTAPGRAGYFTIEVTVDDGRGGTDTSSVTVQVIGTKITMPLNPVSSESGSIRSDGRIISLWTVGDDTVNNGIRTYLSFDISKIARVEEFRSAVLSISTLDQNGTPWADLGGLSIGEIEYGSRRLQVADYKLSSKRLERFASAPTTGVDLTPIISRAVRDKVSRFQIVLYFQTETDEDSSADNVKITVAELTVSYVGETY